MLPLLAAAPTMSWGQDQMRPSTIAGRLFRPVSFDQRDYNVKAGPISFKVGATLRTEFNDNINLSEEDTESDLIVTPAVSASMYWPITPYNALRLNGTFGYNFYLAHPELNNSSSGLTISPDTELSFDLYTGAFRFNIHERPTLQQDPVGEATLSNVALFGRFVNTVGATVEWAVNSKVSLLATYDHTDFISFRSEFSFADFSQDQLVFSSRYLFADAIAGGFEGAAASTRYRSGEKPDAISGHAGLYAEVLVTPYTRFRVAGGFQTIRFDGEVNEEIEFLPEDVRRNRRFRDTATNAELRMPDEQHSNGDNDSYYFSLAISNQLSRYYLHSLTIAKENQLGITSQSVDLWTIRYDASWRVNSLITLQGRLLFDDGQESGARNPESFRRYGASLSTGFQLSRKLTMSIGYDFIWKDSNLPLESYTRNMVFLELHYSF